MDELREMMEAAFDEEEARIAAENPQDEQPESQPEIPEAESKPEESAENSVETPLTGEKKGAKDDAPKALAPSDTDKDTTQSIDQPQAKAPASWSAKARETWGKLPPEAQAEVAKREKEVNQVLQESATARRAITELNQVLGPHAQRLMAAGVQSPIQAIGTLLQTEGVLRQGTAQDKARTIAQLISQYGVDINTLDAVLSNQPIPQQQQQNSNLDELINQRLAPFQQFMTQQQAYAQHQAEQSRIEAQQSVQEFSANAEFINDVRLDMADLMDMAASRGQQMTLPEAYQKACAMHPDISRIMAERERQKAIMGGNEAAKAKRNAAVSITGQPANGGGAAEPNNLRDAISQAWGDAIQG